MERKQSKIAFGFGVFNVFFMVSVLLFITNFFCRMAIMVTMSKMNYMTEIPLVVEPILVILSGICFTVSMIALVTSILLFKEK